MKVAQYKLAFDQSFINLEKHVNNDIAQGWTPLGGVIHSQFYMQAMVIYEDK